MKRLLISFILTQTFGVSAQVCKALFSYGAQFEKVSFYNQSTFSNAHYFWNFGDGTSSNLKNPIHEFPGNGNYLVTMYANDSLTNCSDYYELWLNLTKYSTDPCSPLIYDSIYSNNNNIGLNFLEIKDHSANCNSYNQQYFMSSNVGIGNANTFFISKYFPANYISHVAYWQNIMNTQIIGIKTSPFNFDRSKNYHNCSANFEFSVVSEDSTGQTILFKAMNKNALSYKWYFTGFGSPIISNNDTVTIHYGGLPFSSNYYSLAPAIYLYTTGIGGCKDSLIQYVSVRKKAVTIAGIKEIYNSEIQVKLFPNPVVDKLNLEFDFNSIIVKNISIVNSFSQLVYTLPNPNQKTELDLSSFVAGVYFLSIQTLTQNRVFKVMKQ